MSLHGVVLHTPESYRSLLRYAACSTAPPANAILIGSPYIRTCPVEPKNPRHSPLVDSNGRAPGVGETDLHVPFVVLMFTEPDTIAPKKMLEANQPSGRTTPVTPSLVGCSGRLAAQALVSNPLPRVGISDRQFKFIWRRRGSPGI